MFCVFSRVLFPLQDEDLEGGLCAVRPQLAAQLLAVANSSSDTSWRLRGPVMEAISALTANGLKGRRGAREANATMVVKRLVDARYVTNDGQWSPGQRLGVVA